MSRRQPSERRPWSKARFLAVYWTAQAAVAYLFWPLLMGEGWTEAWRHPEYVAWVVPVLLCITAGQAVLLAPVRKPGEHADTTLARWSRHLMGGIAIGAMAGYACALAMIAVQMGDAPDWLRPLESGTRPFLFPLLVVTPAATLALAFWARRGVPVLLVVAIVACLAASLAMALGLGLMGLFQTALPPERSILGGSPPRSDEAWVLAVIGVLGLSWVVATPLLLAFFRGRDRETALRRVSSVLFLGTLVEAVAIIPVDVMVRRKSQCYCAEGTLWALTLCWGVGTLVLGPAIWLIPMSRRRQRWLAGRCPACEYDMRGCPEAERCPECGAGWKAAATGAESRAARRHPPATPLPSDPP